MCGVSATDAAAVDDVSKVPGVGEGELCAACGYALQGLPAAGTCPECGRAYSDDVIVIYGYARGNHATASTARPRSLIWFALTPVAYVLMFLPALGGRDWAIGVFALLYAAAFGISVWFRRNQTHPGTVQARFNRLGCVQHANTVNPGPRLAGLVFLGGIALLWLVGAVRELDMGWVVALGILSLLCATLYGLIRSQRRRAERVGLMVDLTDDLHRAVPTGWGDTGEFLIERTSDGGGFRLRVEARGRLAGTAIDIEVRMPAERLEGLVRRISSWKEAKLGET